MAMLLTTLSTVTAFLLNLLLLTIGILFFMRQIIGWSIIGILFLIYFLGTSLLDAWRLIRKEKEPNPRSIALFALHVILATILLTNPNHFFHFIQIFAGWWMFFHGFVNLVNCYVCIHDSQHGGLGYGILGFTSISLGLFLIFSPAWAMKYNVLSIIAGIYLCFYGLIGLLFQLSVLQNAHPSVNWSYSAPVLLNAFIPLGVYVSVPRLLEESQNSNQDDSEDTDLYVYNYLNNQGGEAFGHTDISYQGTIYSYGCHDPNSRSLGGTLGDGVLLEANEEDFLNEALNREGKVVIRYGIHLSDEERRIFESRLQDIKSRCVPWLCPMAQSEANQQSYEGFMDYASRVYDGTHATMFKFTHGKFRTYFAAGTNCTLLADSLLRSPELTLVDINGLVTPGAYLAFLNTEYRKHGTIVVSRKLYQPNPEDRLDRQSGKPLMENANDSTNQS